MKTTMLRPLPAVIAAAFAIGCAAPPKPTASRPATPHTGTAAGPAATPAAAGAPPSRGIVLAQSTPAAAAAPVAAPATVAAAPAAAAPAPALPPILPFDDAVMAAANSLFSNADLKSASTMRGGGAKFPLVIDPLVDGNTGFQSVATETMESRVLDLLRQRYPAFDVQPFTTASLARSPLLFIGTFTPVDKEGKNAGPREWHRVCLALVDLRSGVIVSKGFARARMEGVDLTPTAYYLDSPAWAPDPVVQGYVGTCQGTKAGDAIKPAYWDRIMAAAMINDATLAYNKGYYEEALDVYRGVLRQPGGDQLRVYQGMYLAATKLGRKDAAAQAFARIVDHGLAQKQLGVKFLFRPGSTQFLPDPQISGAYPTWLAQLSQRASQRPACLEISGHTSRTGPEPLNERLSLMRAQFIKQRLDSAAPVLARRTEALGRGSSQNISGLGTDDARDALDRRVEFKVKDCPIS